MHFFELKNRKKTRFACTRSKNRTGRMTILATARQGFCGYIDMYRILIDWTPAFGNAARAYGEALQPGLAGRAPNSVPIPHVSAMT